jgi:hypothetical protein
MNNKILALNLTAAMTLLLAGPASFASRARMQALNQDTTMGSSYIQDTRNILMRPNEAAAMPDFATFEAGTTAYSSLPAQGGFSRSTGNMKFGLLLGIDNFFNTALAGSAIYSQVNNPFELIFAGGEDLKWGVGLEYGMTENKVAMVKSTMMALNAGVSNEMFSFNLSSDVGSKGENTSAVGNDQSVKPNYLMAEATYKLGSGMSVFLDYSNSKTTTESGGATTDVKGSEAELGFANVLDIDTANRFFYAISYDTTTTDTGAVNGKTDHNSIPLVIGVEADATSWMILRGSVKQSVLIDTTKTVETDSNGTNTTRVAAGLGLRMNKFLFDAAFEDLVSGTSNTGKINGTKLFSTASLTYTF